MNQYFTNYDVRKLCNNVNHKFSVQGDMFKCKKAKIYSLQNNIKPIKTLEFSNILSTKKFRKSWADSLMTKKISQNVP